jgi:hypothetical protein
MAGVSAPALGGLRELFAGMREKILAAFAASWEPLANRKCFQSKPPFAGNRGKLLA